jgi:N-acetylglucosamine-6-phosphate deacetylase
VNKRLVAIDAGTLFTAGKRISPGRLLIEDASIAAVGDPGTIRVPADCAHIDASGLFVTPGFIDPHVHGCGGVDVMDGTYETLNAVSRILVRHGTTSFLPTTVSSPVNVITHALEQLGVTLSKSFNGATPLGIHLEGPFISAAKRGTHQASHIVAPDLNAFEQWVRASQNTVRLMTVAPELDGVAALVGFAAHFGVTVAMGHSNATFEEARAAAERGVCYAVHTFNAMRAFAHRDPGIVGEVLSDDRIFAEIIADGIHVDEAVVRVFARAKGSSRALLVTDATSATDMPDGSYSLGGSVVEVVNGICRDAEGRLAGSTLTQDIALRNFVKWTDWPLEDALQTLTLNPARALKLEKKGVLEPGADADVVIMDEKFRVFKTMVGGRIVFERGNQPH